MQTASHDGRCLCGTIRYQTHGQPIRVTICHCRFCQRATGGAFMVEPIFNLGYMKVIQGTPSIYSHVSEGSGKLLHPHSCSICSTKLYVFGQRQGTRGRERREVGPRAIPE